MLAALGGRSLPDDLAAAAAAGRIGVAEVTSWLKVQDNAVLRLIAQISGAMRNRLIANERFFPTLAIEIAVGVLTKMTAEVVERNKRDAFWKELDFVASDMALEVVHLHATRFLQRHFRSRPFSMTCTCSCHTRRTT